MNLLRLLLLSYALFAIFLSGGLFFQKNYRVNLPLALFLGLFGLEIFHFLLSTSAAITAYPQFWAIYYFEVGFLYGPLLWVHFRALLDKQFRVKWGHLLHLFPLLLAVIYLFQFYALSGIERMEYMMQNFLNKVMPLNYARVTHALIYGIIIIQFVRKKYNTLNSTQRFYAACITGIYVFTAVICYSLTLFANGWRQFIYYYLFVSTLFFVIAYLLYTEPEFWQMIHKKYFSSGIAEKDKKRIEKKILSHLINHQAYLQKNLSVKLLGEAIIEKPHHISQTLSQRMKVNFNDLINEYRIQFAKKLLVSKDAAIYSIEGIALESGFGNKVSFNKAFKKFVGTTPSAYQKQHR